MYQFAVAFSRVWAMRVVGQDGVPRNGIDDRGRTRRTIGEGLYYAVMHRPVPNYRSKKPRRSRSYWSAPRSYPPVMMI